MNRVALRVFCILIFIVFTHIPCKARHNKPGPLHEYSGGVFHDKRRFIAACLAFPLPVGFLGAHRIFLGSKPYIPVAYVGTLGGCLGIIPLIDFCAILCTKDLDRYVDNPKMFMWIH